MDVQEIEVTIEKNGQVQIHVRGTKGKKCLDLTRELEQALGAQIDQREFTSEAQDDGSGNLIEQNVQVKK